jgi:hypothetical protein
MKARGRWPIDYFRLFYNDTAVGGARSAIRCGLDFFGTDRELFATDCPFDPEGGPMFRNRKRLSGALNGVCPIRRLSGIVFCSVDLRKPSSNGFREDDYPATR